MPFKKSSTELVALFDKALPKSALVERRKMFGYPASFVHGHFFAGLYEESAIIRLPQPLRTQLPDLAQATGFDPMKTGTAMKDWLVIPPAIVARPGGLAALLEAALPLVAALPPKAKKQTKGSARKK